MFRFDKEQKVFTLDGIKVGGQPGENPPLLISSMFHNKDRIVTDRKGNFDRAKAAELIKIQEGLSASTGIPSMATIEGMPVEAESPSCILMSSAAFARSKFPFRSVTIRSLLWNMDEIKSGGFSPGCPPTLMPSRV